MNKTLKIIAITSLILGGTNTIDAASSSSSSSSSSSIVIPEWVRNLGDKAVSDYRFGYERQTEALRFLPEQLAVEATELGDFSKQLSTTNTSLRQVGRSQCEIDYIKKKDVSRAESMQNILNAYVDKAYPSKQTHTEIAPPGGAKVSAELMTDEHKKCQLALDRAKYEINSLNIQLDTERARNKTLVDQLSTCKKEATATKKELHDVLMGIAH